MLPIWWGGRSYVYTPWRGAPFEPAISRDLRRVCLDEFAAVSPGCNQTQRLNDLIE